jgi:D-alanyl-D-alanine carboxypeptidase
MQKTFGTGIKILSCIWLSLFVVACGGAEKQTVSQTSSSDSAAKDDFEPFKNPRFQRAMDSYFDRGSDSNTRWSVEVLAHGPRGQKLSLYSRSSATSVKPASTMKILTSWTAFQELSSASQIGSEKFNYIREMMKYSDNTMAENVLSWSGGINAAYEMLTNFGISRSAGLRLVDGSGLSYDNKLSAHDLVQLLSVIRTSDKMKAFRALMPVAGIDGTLAGRMTNIKGTVAAKTGTLINDPTAALAGYADSQTGWQVVFAMLGDSVYTVDAGRDSIDDAMNEVINTLNFLPAVPSVASVD